MDDSPSFVYLSEKSLDDLGISSRDVVDSLEHLIQKAAGGEAWYAPKSVILPPDGRYIMSTLAVTDDPGLIAVKSVVVNNDNPARGLSAINGMIMLLDSQTGLPRAVVDGNWVTAIRTAGASALAATRLACADSASIAFIGCGVQAHSHLTIFNDLFPLKTVYAVNRSVEKREVLCAAARDKGLQAYQCETAQEACEQADIVISAVSLSRDIKPFLDARWLRPGSFACSVDLGIPWMSEGMDCVDRIIIDDCEQEKTSDQPLVQANLVKGDLKGLVTAQTEGRANDTERTMFLSRAIGLGDLALAGLAYKKSQQTSVGWPFN